MDEISNSLLAMRDKRRQMLCHCNMVFTPNTSSCLCKAKLERARKEIYELRTKCMDLEKNNDKIESETDELTECIHALKCQTATIKRTLQTDDSKLRKDLLTLRNSKVEPVVNDPETLNKVHGKTDSSSEHKTSDDEIGFNNDFDEEENSATCAKAEGAASGRDVPRAIRERKNIENISFSAMDAGRTSKATENSSSDNDLSQSTNMKVDVVKQEVQRVMSGDEHWRTLAQIELNESRNFFFNLDGVHTVLCIDISESMLDDNGWEQTVTFVKDFLNGLSEISNLYGLTNEYVAMVTFGHETIVKQRYTNNYSELLQTFNNLKIGGPSSLYAGLLMSLAAARCSSNTVAQSRTGTIIPTKIILLTDGRPTDVNITAGPDTITSNDEEGKVYVTTELGRFDDEKIDIYIVPVGRTDYDFVDVMLGVSEGLKIDYTCGKRFSRRTFLASQSGPFGSLFTSMNDLTSEDQEDIESVIERGNRLLSAIPQPTPVPDNHYHERKRSQLPSIGSRVRRGPDWKWDLQDNHGPGTVIGHSAGDSEQIWIEWDNADRQNIYRYGKEGFDVLIVDEPREILDGRLQVGCSVKPGKKWNKPMSKRRRGVVIKINKEYGLATVRWDNGHREDLSSELDKEELEYCPYLERHSGDSVFGDA